MHRHLCKLCKKQKEEETHLSGERNVPETQKSESKCYVAPQEVNNKRKNCQDFRYGIDTGK